MPVLELPEIEVLVVMSWQDWNLHMHNTRDQVRYLLNVCSFHGFVYTSTPSGLSEIRPRGAAVRRPAMTSISACSTDDGEF